MIRSTKIMPDKQVIVGVDTHADNHAAVAIDHLGRHLDSIEIPATLAGYRSCSSGPPAWLRSAG
jgi:transposase